MVKVSLPGGKDGRGGMHRQGTRTCIYWCGMWHCPARVHCQTACPVLSGPYNQACRLLPGVLALFPHFRARRVERSQVLYRRPGMSMVSARPPQDWEWPVADALLVRRLVEAAAEAAAEEPGVSGGVTVASRRE